MAERVYGRSQTQCRERWCNVLDPTLKTGPRSLRFRSRTRITLRTLVSCNMPFRRMLTSLLHMLAWTCTAAGVIAAAMRSPHTIMQTMWLGLICRLLLCYNDKYFSARSERQQHPYVPGENRLEHHQGLLPALCLPGKQCMSLLLHAVCTNQPTNQTNLHCPLTGTPWTKSEVAILKELTGEQQKPDGSIRWAAVAAHLPGRTDAEVARQYWRMNRQTYSILIKKNSIERPAFFAFHFLPMFIIGCCSCKMWVMSGLPQQVSDGQHACGLYTNSCCCH